MATTDERLAIAEEKLRHMSEVQDKLEVRITEMKQDAVDRERDRFRAGIGLLGALVLALWGVIWTFRSAIINGGQ